MGLETLAPLDFEATGKDAASLTQAARETFLRPLLWVALGAWLGAIVFFGAGVAPAALRHAPSPIAGDVVRATLAVLDWGGVGTGLFLALAALFLRRGSIAVAIPLLLAVLCCLSQLWLAPAIAAVRPNPLESGERPAAALQFRNLHRVSVGLYGATAAGVLALIVLHGRKETPPQSPTVRSS